MEIAFWSDLGKLKTKRWNYIIEMMLWQWFVFLPSCILLK